MEADKTGRTVLFFVMSKAERERLRGLVNGDPRIEFIVADKRAVEYLHGDVRMTLRTFWDQCWMDFPEWWRLGERVYAETPTRFIGVDPGGSHDQTAIVMAKMVQGKIMVEDTIRLPNPMPNGFSQFRNEYMCQFDDGEEPVHACV